MELTKFGEEGPQRKMYSLEGSVKCIFTSLGGVFRPGFAILQGRGDIPHGDRIAGREQPGSFEEVNVD